MKIPKCPSCDSEYAYKESINYICPMCQHIWPIMVAKKIYRDINGNLLKDGDNVVVIKDMKVKGTSSILKIGTRVKNIKLIDSDHDIVCKIPGWGQMKLKTSIVKKN